MSDQDTPAPAPRVWNKREEYPVDATYVGRPTKWGNPFVIGQHGTRVEVIAKYRAHVANRHTEIRRELRGKDLVCWCAPLPCHADVLLEIANAK